MGEGGIARVYRAHHRRLAHRVFAVKVMLGDWATTMSMRMRFAQEAETASRLQHPNVVPVVDFGRTDQGLLYLAMEFVEGRSLAKIIDDDGPISTDRAIALARQMCLGLAYAHEQGLVHRDFKPDNVLVVETPRGEVARIADFGLAVSEDREHDVRLTAVGIAVGTPVYAAPEQTSNDCEVDHRADLFSLGVTLYEMLAGKLPFDGNIVDVLRHNAAGDPPAISLRSGVSVPATLEQLVRTLMAPDPALRFSDALAVVAALDRVHEVAPAPVAAASPPRSPRSRGLALGLVGATLVAGVGVAVWVRVPASAPSRADARLLPAEAQEVTSPIPPAAPKAAAIVRPADEPALALPSQETAVAPRSQVAVAAAPPTPKKGRRTAVAPWTARKPAPPPPQNKVASPPLTPERAPEESASPSVLPTPTHVEPIPVPVPAPRPALLSPPTVALTRLSVQGALASSVVQRTIGRVQPQLEACYASAAGPLAADTVPISLVIDENGAVDRVQLGGGKSATASSCIADVLRRARTNAPPDVGTVRVSFTLVMRRVPR
ncbi:MAG: protein kinase [Deltaproteobacteria bacterium]|nr:protein kinase [Deltaproteobacteria bacterium]MDQ3299823.1 protein kinase [Myxococcota bacterium]